MSMSVWELPRRQPIKRKRICPARLQTLDHRGTEQCCKTTNKIKVDPYLNIQFGLDKDVLGYAVHVVELCRTHTCIKPYCSIKAASNGTHRLTGIPIHRQRSNPPCTTMKPTPHLGDEEVIREYHKEDKVAPLCSMTITHVHADNAIPTTS
jgi:hypothetical protein